LDALLAGNIPDKTPMTIENTSEKMMSQGVIETIDAPPILVFASKIAAIWPIVPDITKPTSNPRIHPTKPIKADSTMNRFITSLLFIPIAFSIPICLVLSVTDVNIVFAIPTAPTTNEIVAIP